VISFVTRDNRVAPAVSTSRRGAFFSMPINAMPSSTENSTTAGTMLFASA
jgi:hypothetical protein